VRALCCQRLGRREDASAALEQARAALSAPGGDPAAPDQPESRRLVAEAERALAAGPP
jgi:hypothetical protein